MPALPNPFAIGSNIKTDPSQMEVQNAKLLGSQVPFVKFRFRFSHNRNKDKEGKDLHKAFQSVAEA